MVVDTALYDIIGVDPSADDRTIKKAFMKKAKELHPDKNKDPDATIKFQELNEAYEILKKQETREMYDRYGIEGLKDKSDVFGDAFEHIFARKRRTADVINEVSCSLEDLYSGCTKKCDYCIKVQCKKCKGNGTADGSKPPDCTCCGGNGVVIQRVNMGFAVCETQVPCPECEGSGTGEIKKKCKVCKGECLAEVKKTVDVHIEKGMRTGSKIVFKGCSHELPGFEVGDVIFEVVEESHPRFERSGDDLLYKLDICLYEAFYGFKSLIDTLDDRKLLIKETADKVINSGDTRLIPGEGMPNKENPYKRGNLYVQYSVRLPAKEDLKFELKAILRKVCKYEDPLANMDLKDESITRVKMEEGNISEFYNKKHTRRSERRREAYGAGSSDDYDYENEQGAQCAPQ